MAKNLNLDDLGNAIEAIIDQAVNSQDYQKLNQAIRQAVNTAVDTGGEAVRQAVDSAAKKRNAKRNIVDARTDDAPRYTPPAQPWKKVSYQANKNIYSSRLGSSRSQAQPQSNLPALYRNPSGKLAGGICETVGGSVLTLFGSGGIISTGIVGLVAHSASLFSVLGLVSLAAVGGGAWLLAAGIRSIRKVGRFERYVKALGSRTQCELQYLARLVGKPVKYVRKELKGMIDDGLFLEGHLDEAEGSLITSDDTYIHYLEAQRQQAIRQQEATVQAREAEKAADKKKQDSQVQEVLDRGNAFIRQIRKCNDAIPGQEISGKITRMETLVRKIFDRAEAHPEVVPDLKKLMDYYLPMTVKLLNAYAEMDAQPIQGETIQNSKREIEATLDTLNSAFEKLLDSIFKETALDVSTDISVLQTLLAQEGLTDDDLAQLRKNKN